MVVPRSSLAARPSASAPRSQMLAIASVAGDAERGAARAIAWGSLSARREACRLGEIEETRRCLAEAAPVRPPLRAFHFLGMARGGRQRLLRSEAV